MKIFKNYKWVREYVSKEKFDSLSPNNDLKLEMQVSTSGEELFCLKIKTKEVVGYSVELDENKDQEIISMLKKSGNLYREAMSYIQGEKYVREIEKYWALSEILCMKLQKEIKLKTVVPFSYDLRKLTIQFNHL